MNVKCERCSTEYEFDDALVSGRGTTVKCTNCGHKFKIRRGESDYSEDFWNVTTGDGRTLVFTSLRELQRAIQSLVVERNDRLSRGGLPPKAIGQIPELAPFFDQREASKNPPLGRPTQSGLGPGPDENANSPTDRVATIAEFPAPPPEPIRSVTSTLLGTGPVVNAPAFSPSVRPRMPSIPPPLPARARQPSIPPERPPGGPSNPPPLPARPAIVDIEKDIETAPVNVPSVPPVRPRMPSIPPPLPEAARVSAPPAVSAPPPPERAPSNPPVVDRTTPLPRAPRSLAADVDEGRASLPDGLPTRRRSVGGFVVATVVIGCVLVLGAVWAQKNLGVTLAPKPAAPPPVTVDPRVSEFLASGDKALASGNLELAKESFDKASALAEKDPKVRVALAHLAAVRADVPWLKSRLLAEEATDERRITRDGLEELASAARKAADEAIAIAPEDPAALRAKIDAARISGDRDGARALVGKIGASSSEPETAYVLAALDLAEATPLWPTIIDRLKAAASAESGPGRARAALVYALARSGDAAAAKAEVDRLGAMPKAHPLLPLLRALADHAGPAAIGDAGVGDAAVADAHGKGRRGAGGGGGGGGGGDARDLIVQGERARARGEFAKARGFFQSALDRNPDDSEALAGLAAIAHAQGDGAGARAAYKRVLGVNPNYLPALVGLADLDWESGDKAAAARMYKDIVDRYPEGAYPPRVKQRADGGG